MRAHFILLVESYEKRPFPVLGPLPVGPDALDAKIGTFGDSAECASMLVCRPWEPVQNFLAADGLSMMLDIVQASPGER